MKKAVSIIIPAAVIAVAAYLLLQIPGPAKSPAQPFNATGATDEWLGIYIQGQRVGYAFTKVTKSDDGLLVESRSKITVFMMQEARSISTTLFAQTDRDYTLKEFRLEIATAGHPTKIEGSIAGKTLTLTSYSQGIPQTETTVLKDKPYFPDALEEIIKEKKLKPGDEISIPYFDPTTQSQSLAKIKIFDAESVQVRDQKKYGTKVRVDFIGMETQLWLDDDYRLLREYTPAMDLEMIPITREEALAEIETNQVFDLLSFFAVKIDNPAPFSHALKYLKLRLSGIEIGELQVSDDFQQLVSEDPLIVASTRPELAALPRLTLPITDQAEFLKSSVYIQSDHPEIIAAGREIVGPEKDAARAAEKLVHGVYRMLKKNPVPSLPSALDVLKTREGDCNEHAVLFAALARAVGIPAKIYVGLVNIYGDSYWYHAWCAVWLGKWVPVDPTFDQFPADLNHLKLKEGEISEQAKVLTVVGKLRIAVEEYR